MVELIWDGKYDANGKKVAPLRLKLPFQTVETVNESAQERQLALDLFSQGRDGDWRNRLIWGDKKYVLPALLDEFAGQVDLIYIDPPFNVGSDFSFNATIPENPLDNEFEKVNSFLKSPSIIEQKAYRDTWGRGLSSYLQWFYETVLFIRELLSENGSIYIHLDSHMSHYCKIVLDEVFAGGFLNEIVWKRTGAHNSAKGYGPVHDVILYFSKSNNYIWNQHYQTQENYLKERYTYIDEKGRYFSPVSLIAAGIRTGSSGMTWRGIDVTSKGNHWRYGLEKLEELDKAGDIYWPSKGDMPRLKMYLENAKGSLLQDWWGDISAINSQALERLGYPTQKPELLLERIIKASSNEGDLVLDCFCGSGTTATVAEKLGRRWIACDLGRFAIHTTRKRLLSIPNVKPFTVQNLGKYERQAWQAAEFGDEKAAAAVIRRYRHFILELYQAQPVEGYAWLHGIKNGRLVHVGSVDSPVSPGDVQQIAIEFRKAIGTGQDAPKESAVDVLGWDFAFELNEVARQQAIQANINMRFIKIPREVLEKRAVEQGDIRFFELAALGVDTAVKKRAVTVKLVDFIIPPDDVPQDVQAAIKHWSQWIDYWAVDWDNQGDTFHNMWQAYRTRQDSKLLLQTSHDYDQPGEYKIMIKVIDILGNDTTKTVLVSVA